MASSRSTKLRIAASVLLAPGFWDAIAGRFVWQTGAAANTEEAESPVKWRDLAGAVHIHSNYSDGLGSVPDVMEAAQKAGADWVLLTDHNTQKPLRDRWEEKYNAFPLLLIGTEVTVEHGAFILALQMPPDWEPTKAQKPQVAINEVREQNGLPLVSLPFDVKHPWRAWEADGCEGLEIINLSTVARRHINLLSLVWLWPLYRFGGAVSAMTALLTRPDQALARWDNLLATGKRFVGLGALDAHAQTKIGRKKYPFPTYEETFRMVTTHALVPPETLPGNPTRSAIYHALRQGRAYVCYDALGNANGFDFWAKNESGETAAMGACITRGTNGAVAFSVSVPFVPKSPAPLVRLLKNGNVVASGRGALSCVMREAGAYRVEVFRFGFCIGPLFLNARSWIFSNPIYVR